jgi:hypothetical protein
MVCVVLLAAGAAGANPRSGNFRPPREPARPVTEAAGIGVWLQRLAGRYRFEGMVEVRMRATVEEEPPAAEGTEPGSLAAEIIARERMESGQSDVLETTPVRGVSDCVTIGTGPGVQCVLQVTWKEMREVVAPSTTERGGVFNLPGGASNLAPAMAMYGLDPGQAVVRYLQVDSAGLAEGASGSVVGNTATFRTPCANTARILNSLRPPPIRKAGSSSPPQPPRTCDRITRIEARPDAKTLYMRVDFALDGRPKTTYSLLLRRVAQSGEVAAAAAPAAAR